MKFLDDLNLSAESILVLIIAWKCKAAVQCEFTREEFITGMQELGTDSIDKLRAKLPSLENEIKDFLKFKEFYHFTFNYAKNPGQKGLELDMAIAYWEIVLRGRFKFLDEWCKFLLVIFVYIFNQILRLRCFIFSLSFRNITRGRFLKTRGICCSISRHTSTTT